MNILNTIYAISKAAVEIFWSWIIPPKQVTATVTQLEMNRYKVLVHFKDRDVAFQFKRPRGPRTVRDVPSNIIPYLQNDMITPIKIYKVPPPQK